MREALRRVQSDCSGSKEVLRVTWIADLGAPKEPGIYEVRGLQVRVRALDIQELNSQLAVGCSDVVFNLIRAGVRRHTHDLGTIATD